jgi:hypothetical protein
MAAKTRAQIQEAIDEGVRRLQIYFDREGHCKFHREHKEDDGYFLGRFIKNTLSKYTNGYLSDENIAKLEAFQGWEWTPKTKRYNDKLNKTVLLFKQFYKKHGHLAIPADYEVEGITIANDIHYYRDRYRRGASKVKEIRALESVPGWTWEALDFSMKAEDKWEVKYQLLLKYAMINGDSLVPQLLIMEGHKLGSWVSLQRILYAEAKLLDRRIKRLEKLPCWVWGKVTDLYFQDGIRCLIEYFQAYGVKMPPQSLKTTYGVGLHEWIITQRRSYKCGTLPKSRIKKLESIDGWAWSSKDQTWFKWYDKLKDFSYRFGHVNVSTTYKVKGLSLKKWVDKVRRHYVKEELSQDKRQMLESLQGWDAFVKNSHLYRMQQGFSEIGQHVIAELEKGENLSLSQYAKRCNCSIGAVVMYKKKFVAL